jgi:hypothetical protein
MKVIYEGTDITKSIDVKDAVIKDKASGPDILAITFADIDGKWAKWKPQLGESIEIVNEGYSSGSMYIDRLKPFSSAFVIEATAQPLSAKSNGFQAWENVRFKTLSADLANQSGLEFESYEIIDWLYQRFEKDDENPLECLSRICSLESYSLKVRDGKAIIYSEPAFEKKVAVKTYIRDSFIGEPSFELSAIDLKSSCIVRYGSISYKFDSPEKYGGTLKEEVKIYNLAEAERFSKGILRTQNKYKQKGSITVQLNNSVTAGNVIKISAGSFLDGTYFVYECIRNIVINQMVLNIRGCLEGY